MYLSKFLGYFLIFIAPIAIIVLGELLTKHFLVLFETGVIKTSLYAVIGVICFATIYLSNTYALRLLRLKPIYLGNVTSVMWGIIIGILISLASGFGFAILNGYSLHFSNLFLNFDMKVIGNLYPALTEEVYFRGGVVNVVSQSFGRSIGLASGSLPFGLIHIIGVFFGKTVTIAQIIGISLAGLMLSLMYFRFGLLGPISTHLMWNAVVSGWQNVYAVQDENIVSLIESSWITCTLLLLVCIVLYVLNVLIPKSNYLSE